MKKTAIPFLSAVALMLVVGCQNAEKKNTDAVNINPMEMKQIGTVSERFQSYNVEMVEAACVPISDQRFHWFVYRAEMNQAGIFPSGFRISLLKHQQRSGIRDSITGPSGIGLW
ncbi:hypothetical protein [Parapedobacter sp.]